MLQLHPTPSSFVMVWFNLPPTPSEKTFLKPSSVKWTPLYTSKNLSETYYELFCNATHIMFPIFPIEIFFLTPLILSHVSLLSSIPPSQTFFSPTFPLTTYEPYMNQGNVFLSLFFSFSEYVWLYTASAAWTATRCLGLLCRD